MCGRRLPPVEGREQRMTELENCGYKQKPVENTAMYNREKFKMFPTAASGRAFWMRMVMKFIKSMVNMGRVRIRHLELWSFHAFTHPLVLLSLLCSKSPLEPRLGSLVEASSVQVLAEYTVNVFKTRGVQLRTFLEAKSGPNTRLSTVKTSSRSPSPHKTRLQTPAKTVG
ncbi:hypothetical protein BTUL_0051g00360 [Botrytis tulipae]|uniref:Uncharacterized protein n=1 Tax=Botrytis tulipae TaxID=87230 RepID=A0A4Z1EZB7_9HELO|nr:hypothetical protein BTUL_0051g00360 [Botrytis tulipae]